MKTLLIAILLLSSCATQKDVKPLPAPPAKEDSTTAPSSPQKAAQRSDLIDHKFFKISYDAKARLARYVIYRLSREHLKYREAKRADKFIADPLLKEKNLPFVSPSEYSHSGYDRGHLAPSADFAWNQEANNLTFVMSNMAPQSKSLNRDAWRRLEDRVRKWACGEGLVTVITGPVLKNELPHLESGLAIPQDFFKVVIDETPPVKMIAFIYHQEDKGDVLKDRVVPLPFVEKMTGLAFGREFPQMKNDKLRMPASVEDWAEADCAN